MIPIPTNTESVIDPRTGHMRPSWRQFLDRLRTQFAQTSESLSAGKAAKTQTAWASWLIPAPEDKDYPVIVNAGEGFTITEVTTKTAVGTATVVVKINGTPLGGGASSASTSESTVNHASNNVVSAGDDVTITVSGTTNAEDLSVTIKGTMELAT